MLFLRRNKSFILRKKDGTLSPIPKKKLILHLTNLNLIDPKLYYHISSKQSQDNFTLEFESVCLSKIFELKLSLSAILSQKHRIPFELRS